MIDDVISFGFGRRMTYTGYFKRMDLIGLDFGYTATKGRGLEPWKPIAERVERGELGMKSGKGFYDWPGDTAKQLHRRLGEVGHFSVRNHISSFCRLGQRIQP